MSIFKKSLDFLEKFIFYTDRAINPGKYQYLVSNSSLSFRNSIGMKNLPSLSKGVSSMKNVAIIKDS